MGAVTPVIKMDVPIVREDVKVVELLAPRIVAPPHVRLMDVQVAVQGHVRVRVQELLVKELHVRQNVMEAILILLHLQQN
jgi:hypothetical protein